MQTITCAAFLLVAMASPPKVAESVPRRFEPAPLEAVRLEGLLAARMKTNLEGRLLRVDEAGILDGFRHRPGKQEWIGEHAGKFLDAAARVWLYTKDARLEKLMKRVARELVATQEPDGYLGTYTRDQRWTSWDVWVHKYDLLGLLAYHRATGDASVLSAAVRVGDLLLTTFAPGKRDLVAAGTHVGMAATSVLGPMVELYRQTGDARYLDFCRAIVAAYDQPNGPKIVATLLATGDVHKTANGKAYEMLSNLIGLVQLHAVTGDRRLLDAVLAGWKDVAKNRLYVTGTASSREHFQPAQVLPGELAHNIGETCVTVNWLELNLELFRLTGEPRFADELERTVANHLLGAQDACNGDFCYYTPLNGPKPYGPGINCCVSSGPRGISRLPELAWGRLDGAPAMALWTPGMVTMSVDTPAGSVRVALRVRTDFPASGRVRVEVQPDRPATFPIHLRVPAWATRFSVAGVGDGKPGTFFRVERAWKRGDRLDVEMDLPVRLVDGGPSYPGRVAVVRGPQVLALDAALDPDLPDRTLVALAGTAPALAPLAVGKRGCAVSARWGTPGLALASGDVGAARTPRELTLVPYADARAPQLWLLAADRVEEYLKSRRERDQRRARIDVRRAATAPVIDGRLNEAVWSTSPVPMAKRVGRGVARSRSSYDVTWDDEHVYVAVWVTDPTPQTRQSVTTSDHVAVIVDGDREAEGAIDARTSLVRHRWDEPAVTTGVRRASARTKDGYTVELAIPWSRIKRRPEAGLELAFEIRNHDQGVVGIDDDGDWQWGSGEVDAYGIARLAR